MRYPFALSPFFLLFVIAGMTTPATSFGQQATHLVISQVFGGGGTSSTTYANDFVELYNPTSSSVNVAGWSVQYALGTSTSWTVWNLSGAVPAKGYFLIGLGTNNVTIGRPLPTPDLTAITNIGSVNVKVGLVNSTTAFTTANPSASCIDFLGTGNASGFEGAGAGPVGNNTISWLRLANASATAVSMAVGGADEHAGNGYDADNNAADFVTESNMTARNSMIVLPLVFTAIRASLRNDGIQLDWTVAGAIDIDQYIVQKSTDGIRFQDVGSIKTTAHSDMASSYEWIDGTPGSGANNYYRIKAMEISGNALYSKVLSMDGGIGKAGFSVYPNPVSGSAIILQMNDEPAGRYTVSLFNAIGQEVYRQVIEYAGGSAIQQLAISALTVKGFYSLRVSNGKSITSHALISR